MADATAAEVKQSAGEYTAARRDLSGYQVVLDLLVAQHFGMPDAPEVLRMGAGLDLSSREQFAASVAALGVGDVVKRKKEKKELSPTLVADVEALARRPDLHFFHWEIEFPEVFFGFEDAEQRRIRHKNEIAVGTSGFDAVVGNPPYVRVELVGKDCKSYLKAHYRTVVDRCDIYVAFIEVAMRAREEATVWQGSSFPISSLIPTTARTPVNFSQKNGRCETWWTFPPSKSSRALYLSRSADLCPPAAGYDTCPRNGAVCFRHSHDPSARDHLRGP